MASGKSSTDVKRAADFWAHVDRSGECWLWQGRMHWKGYGQLSFNGVEWRAHRLAYALTYGPIPPGQMVLHTCDRRACCRPDHLYIGTHRQNMRDRDERGRSAAGDRHGCAKLAAVDVLAIRQLRLEGVPRDILAGRFGVTKSQIDRIVSRRSWSSVGADA